MKFYQNNLLPFQGEVYLIHDYLSDSERMMEQIKAEVQWRNDKIKMFGKTYDQARKVSWHGDKGITYTYSKIQMVSPGWVETLKDIKKRLKKDCDFDFNSVLVNLYRSGDDYMSYHQDNEPELGENPIIASLSMGVERDFHLKHIETNEVIKLNLKSGDLLIMQGETQKHWKHSLPKRKRVNSERLNLTYRKIKK